MRYVTREIGGEVNLSLGHSNTIRLTPPLCRAVAGEKVKVTALNL